MKFNHKQLLVEFDNNFDRIPEINKRNTRASQKKNQLYIPRFRTNKLQKSVKYRGIKVWIGIPKEITNNNGNFATFKKSTKTLNLTSYMVFAKIKNSLFWTFC